MNLLLISIDNKVVHLVILADRQNPKFLNGINLSEIGELYNGFRNFYFEKVSFIKATLNFNNF
ncbi:hypothetical protein A1E_03000 [Rickettsia canadensis str. McKiel]|uniref:Uncharacterized protein n=1 Tax=Rickettsia canadensis (strain McKiel) TaxID=293613 RepID=A8EYV7_RICCK|nr:hypothetical protein A1E_03000 [Rickettsia canadensis str. McKiel]